MKTYDTSMAKHYDWSMLPFKPDDNFLKKMLSKFELVGRTDGRGNYWIDLPGFENIYVKAPNTLFHQFVIRSVENAIRKSNEAGQNIYEYMLRNDNSAIRKIKA